MNATAQQTSKENEGRGTQTQANEGKGANGGMTHEASPQEHSEGAIAKTIEQQTAKLPSDIFLWAAIGGMGVSAVLELTGAKDKSRFIGQWVAPLLLFGVYNKMVKQHGSDRTEQQV